MKIYPLIILGLLFIIFFCLYKIALNYGFFQPATVYEEKSEYEYEELEWRISELEDCLEELEENMYDVRSILQNYGESYEDLYNTIWEAESTLSPELNDC